MYLSMEMRLHVWYRIKKNRERMGKSMFKTMDKNNKIMREKITEMITLLKIKNNTRILKKLKKKTKNKKNKIIKKAKILKINRNLNKIVNKKKNLIGSKTKMKINHKKENQEKIKEKIN